MSGISFAGVLLDPQSFVRHLHTDRENQTCHWGFDATHWRSYVHISDAYYKRRESSTASNDDRASSPSSDPAEDRITPEKALALLDEVKKRFNHPKLSRKQVRNYTFRRIQ